MVDGVASLMTQPHGTFAAGMMSHERGTNITDSGAPFYDVYECSDGKWVSIGAVEKKFYQEVLRLLDLDSLLADQWNRDTWSAAKSRISQKIKTCTRDEWCAVFEGTESCFAPVLTLEEAPITPIFRRAPRMWKSMASRNPHRHLGSAEPFLPHRRHFSHGIVRKHRKSSVPGWTARRYSLQERPA